MTMSSLWNADWKSSVVGGTQTITTTGPSWHATIAPGETWSIGYVAQGSAAPTGCVVNATTCTFVIG